MTRLKSYTAMFAVIIGLMIGFNRTAAAQVCVTNPVVVNLADSGAGSLRQAVIDACPGSTITFGVTGTIPLTTRQIVIDKNLMIQGPGANLLTVLTNIQFGGRVFFVNSGVTATLAGMTVTGRELLSTPTGEHGGGINNQGSLTVTDSIITGSTTVLRSTSDVYPNGGIYNAGPGANLTVTNSTVSNNSVSGSGGGIFNNFGTVTITKSIITGNISKRYGGGGISNNGGEVTVTDSTVSLNRSERIGPSGGGLINDNGGTITLINSTVSSNKADKPSGGGGGGGGVRSRAEEVTVTDSTVSHDLSIKDKSGTGGFNHDGSTITPNSLTVLCNTTAPSSGTSDGGGIANVCGTVNLINSTITKNAASAAPYRGAEGGLGGGIYNASGATVNSRNSIIAGSLSSTNIPNSPDFYGALISQGYNLIGTNEGTSITGDTTGNIVGTPIAPINPLLAALANNGGPTPTHALLPGSIAIDKGNSTLTTDQRGAFRPIDDPNSANGTGNLTDIGAFEVQSPTAAAVTISGLVLISNGRGLTNALVYLTDQSGATRIARSSAFGYYRFEDVAAGQTVIMTVVSKRYQFTPQVVNVTDNLSELSFISQP